MESDPRHHVLVVGGGVVGLTAAAALLSRAPHLSVTVLEKGRAGSGASQYAGALDLPYFRDAAQRALIEASWAWHDARGPRTAEYRHPVPMTWYAEPHVDLRAQLITPLSDGEPRRSPAWRPPEGVRELRGEAFVIDPRAWCRDLAREVIRSGRGELVERAEALAIEPGLHGEMRVRCADGRTYAAAHVVLALGPWLPGWDGRTQAWAQRLGLRTKRVFGLNVVVDPRVSAFPPSAVGWPGADLYFHPAPAGDGYRLSLRHDEWDVDPDAAHQMVDAVLDRAGRFLDDLIGAGRWSVTGHRVFVDSYTPQMYPVVAPCGSLGGRVTAATGTHGSGVRLAPGIAERVARAVLASLDQTGGAA